MPSVLLSPASGSPFPVYSGNLFSGQGNHPVGIVQLRWAREASGNAYIYLSGGNSGGLGINSGGVFMSGGQLSGLSDGMVMYPGDAYSIPKSACGASGQLGIYASCDSAASGVGRLYFESF